LTLARKLRATSKDLESWRHKKVGHVNSQLAHAREVLHQLEMEQDSQVLLDNEVWLMRSLSSSLTQEEEERHWKASSWISGFYWT